MVEPTSVVLDADRDEVRVEEQRNSSQTLSQVLATVEDWLEEADGIRRGSRRRWG